MRNLIKYYIDNIDSLEYEFDEYIVQYISSKSIIIKMTFLYNADVDFEYNLDNDYLTIVSHYDRYTLKYPDFSKLSNGDYYFQKMTIWEHLCFGINDVTMFLNEINRIKNEAQFTKNT